MHGGARSHPTDLSLSSAMALSYLRVCNKFAILPKANRIFIDIALSLTALIFLRPRSVQNPDYIRKGRICNLNQVILARSYVQQGWPLLCIVKSD